MRRLVLLAALLLTVGRAWAGERPGNVFVEGDEASARVPAIWKTWRAIDIDRKEVGHGDVRDGIAEVGKLPIGYFELRETHGGGDKVTAAVLAKNEAVEDTPIALDAAIAWFYSEPEKIRDACALAKLAGVRWVRDRASWPELETARGTWAGDTRYERAMRIEHEMGLKVLQVNHIAPAWASKDAKRFPEDLRDVYNFYRGLSQRWKGLADAIEPWNEPDIDMFGGHTGCEIASFQKAAYLGLKAGDPQTPVCGTVFAIDRAETLDEFGLNEVHPYFDRYDLHHYIRLPEYPRAYGRHRAVSGGKPMWTTEFNLTVQWADEKTKEPSDDELRVQGYRVGKVFAQALHEGPEKTFYFILGDYVERDRQFGILHGDLTPRPAYVSFAAVGRLLNGAQPLGKVDLGDEKLKAYAFRTRVDGADRETLVAWSETKPTTIDIPSAERAYDYLGRELSAGGTVELTRATIYLLLPPGGSKSLKIQPPPATPSLLKGEPCPIVLQLLGPTDFQQSAFRIDQSKELRLVAYNFGGKPVRGRLSVEGATGSPGEIELAAGARDEWKIRADGPGQLKARLDAGDAGRAIVSARLAVAPPPPSSQPK